MFLQVKAFILAVALLVEWGPHQVNGYFVPEKNKDFKYECMTGEHIYYFGGKFDDSGKDDRLWNFDCRRGFVSNDPEDCYWSESFFPSWKGSWYSLPCGAKEIITGIESKYHKDDEYRTWKLKCCKVKEDMII